MADSPLLRDDGRSSYLEEMDKNENRKRPFLNAQASIFDHPVFKRQFATKSIVLRVDGLGGMEGDKKRDERSCVRSVYNGESFLILVDNSVVQFLFCLWALK